MSAGLRATLARRPAQPAGALVLLHGRGADEHDLVPLLHALDPDGRLAGVTVQAPLRLPPGGRHWYVSREVGRPDRTTFLETYARLCACLDDLPALTGVSLGATVLGGFSQGAVMAYAAGLGHGRPSPAGLIALSGFIPRVEGFALDLAVHRDVPVAIGHGVYDPVIPVELGRAAAHELRAAGLAVELRESAMLHAIDGAFIAHLADVLRDLLRDRLAA